MASAMVVGNLPVRTLVEKLRRNLGDDAATPVYVLTGTGLATAAGLDER